MKIENDKPNPLTGQTESLKPTAPTGDAGGASKTGGATSADQLTLSPEAQLLKEAEQATASSPDVRAELVEKMRALLADGKLGNDATALAESLIDDVLKNR